MEAATILPNDPRAVYLAHREEVDAAVLSTLLSGSYILGEKVREFEEAFARYCDVKHAICVANGTDALELALRACGIGPGSLVITAANTVSATVQAIIATGAKPYLVDVDPATFTIDCARLEAILRSSPPGKFRAILPVHLYGLPANMTALNELADSYQLKLVEDCAQAQGAAWKDRKVGGWSDASSFSFYPTKNLGCFGDGGAVLTNNDAIAQHARQMRQYGWQSRYISEGFGRNSRLDEIQAAVLQVRLRYLDAENAQRRQNATFYNQALRALPIRLPSAPADAFHVYHQYTICSDKRSKIEEALAWERIGYGILYPVPIHLQPAFAKLERDPKGLPITEQLSGQLLNLPIHPQLSAEQLGRVVACIKQALH
jgi:dTDP-4-amino-4,6-dideoxygalactose transaminase